MSSPALRREFLRTLGLSAAALPFVLNLPGLARGEAARPRRRQRMIVMFSPNGTVPKNFWPDQQGKEWGWWRDSGVAHASFQ